MTCNGSDSPVCEGKDPGTKVDLKLCPVDFEPASDPFNSESDCLDTVTVGADFPDEDKSDVLEITVTLPDDFAA